MKTVIIGSGSWGTALGQVLVDNQQEVAIYGIVEAEVADINENHRNSKYFPDVILNEKLRATSDFSVVKDADLIVMSVPSIVIGELSKQVNEVLVKDTVIVNTAKGFHPQSHVRLSEIIKESFTSPYFKAVVNLIGPSHAEEVVRRLLTTVNAVSDDLGSAQAVQKLFSNNYFRVYTSDDVVGSEIGVALKNIMALASGILDGLNIAGDNAKAALITRGLAEMARYGLAKGGRLETFLGLTGIGDLVVTCTSVHSRNYQAGFQIGENGGAEYFWANNTKTVEGVKACEIVWEEAQKSGIRMPITQQVYKVLFEKADPAQCISELMTRSLKAESVLAADEYDD